MSTAKTKCNKKGSRKNYCNFARLYFQSRSGKIIFLNQIFTVLKFQICVSEASCCKWALIKNYVAFAQGWNDCIGFSLNVFCADTKLK